MDSYFLAECISSTEYERALYFAVHVTPKMYKTIGRIRKALDEMNRAGLEIYEIHKHCAAPIFFRDFLHLPMAQDLGKVASVTMNRDQFDKLMKQLPNRRRAKVRASVIRIGNGYVMWQCKDWGGNTWETPMYSIGE